MTSSATASSINSRLGPGQIYSQPSLTGAGQKDNTILVSALDALKLHKSPVRLEDFALTHGLTRLVEDEVLRERFKGHPRVEWNAKLDLWMYKPEHDLRSPRDLIALLEKRYTSETSRCAGMRLAELRESYPLAKEAVEDFAKTEPKQEREVLVLRGKDQSAKMVFWNEFRGEQAKGPDDEFRELWHQQKVPDAVDLARSLEADGLTSANLIASTATHSGAANRGGKRGGRGGKKGDSRGRKVRIQNTHLEGVDLSKDYTAQ
ncbi:hypothetical protein BCV69DRAFT_312646 [Microstroma glucosiphilum]|uniref:Transcription initiation factor IIE subunit beta n=1 Tax=Pseudomicrostroma glucosiphilum TaxID=1684307 RepID=A0A316UCF7_9BASI|nr:hypothetical protein BCV69DRAFT_312646 [Pseudomicrostroma glucosiphilum]PWN20695.1 hypothetical protein BCV69DRAFT_312646 [Pseudomicrostroma glucosiphilum]